ncbi:lactate racemase domain-containing protein [Botrimarina sp.]|uniref:lactate racemase domain-containing protein n=1 Tax=Botrimarina sp. TaxID=2795802 RepID=UPI0032EA9ECA
MSVTFLRCGAPPETSDRLTADRLRCAADPIDPERVARLAVDALADPLGLPPLARCVTPDDRVAIAVGHGTPAAAPLVAGVIASLAAAGIDRSRIHVVAANAGDSKPLAEALADAAAAGVRVEAHDPANEEALCFAGLAKGDRPLLVNRTLFEADLVLPVSAEPTTGDSGGLADTAGGAYDGLFPDFFDQSTIDRFRKVRTVHDADLGGGRRLAARRAEADQAGWIIGAPFVVRVVPGPGGGVAAVVAGEADQVGRHANDAASRAWRTPLAEPADVVLAVVTGGPDQQTWEAVGRALESAERLVRSGGVIAVWSELEEPIGPELARLAEADDPVSVASDLSAESGPAALAAWRVMQAVERGPVFLRSRLSPDAVEPLGIAPVESEEQMLRMAGRFGDCVLLEDAQHVRFPIAAEEPE